MGLFTDRFLKLAGVAFAAVGLVGCKSVQAESVVPASSAEVWAVLMDGEHYGEWNPVLPEVQGKIEEGATLSYKMATPSGEIYDVEAEVVELDPERALHQSGGTWGILTFDNYWTLESVDGGTRVTQREEYAGVGVLFWDPSWYEAAYGRAIAAMKDRLAR